MTIASFRVMPRRAVGGSYLSPFLRTQPAAIGNVSNRSVISSIQVKHIRASTRSLSYQSASSFGAAAITSALVAAGVATTSLLTISDATRNNVALMEGSNNNKGALMAMHEPGSVEEIQHTVAECFGSSHFHGNVKSSAERLVSLVQQAFTQVLMEYTQQGSSFNTDYESNKLPDNKFPSLEVSLLNENCRFEFNSREPIPIENDFFSGRIQINLNSHCEKNKRSMNGTKDMFEIQLQGRFKRIPKGVMYCGGELANDNFRFSPLMKGLANALLKLLAKYIGNDLEYSFGSTHASGGSRLPFISFPLKTAMNDIIVTPSGEMPPRMGEPFVETNESRTIRKRSTIDAKDWSLEDTYSMSFTASSLDLTTWKVLYPFETNLSLFWGNSPLRLVIYEKGETHGHQGIVDTNTNNYLLALQTKFVGVDKAVKSKNSREGGKRASLYNAV